MTAADDRRATGPARLDATVRGVVQGVGFRAFVWDQARRLGLTGWVSNGPGRTVHCVAEGDRAALERLLGALREGPPGSIVDDTVVRWMAPTGEFDGFAIRSGWHPGD